MIIIILKNRTEISVLYFMVIIKNTEAGKTISTQEFEKVKGMQEMMKIGQTYNLNLMKKTQTSRLWKTWLF